jgi:hypothetical protein
MFYYYFFLLSFSVASFYFHDAIKDKCKKIKSFYDLVSMHHSKIGTILYVMICVLVKSLYLSFIQKINKTMKQIDKNTFELTYTVNHQNYKMLIKMKRGPRRLLYAFDENNKDITDIIQMYYGPNEDFHHNKFTPGFFGLENLTLSLSDGSESSFTKTDAIIIS